MKRKIGLAMLLAASVTMFGGCNGNGSFGLSSFLYDDAEKYTMGGATLEAGDIDTVDIAWVSGDVQVKYHEKDTVIISETANKDLNEENSLYYRVDGDTLKIKYVKSGKWDFSRLQKNLTVWLPEELELAELKVESVSADLQIDEIAAEKAMLDTISGEMELGQVKFSKNVEISTTSGKVTGSMEGRLEKLETESVSGGLKITVEELGVLNAQSTSGDIELTAEKAPTSIEAETVSGEIILYLPEDTGFTAELDSVSGEFKCDFEVSEKKDRYQSGDSSNYYEFDTVSGDVRIKKK
ncbi:MAG: DUF4097 family beta strand repeat protein [Lachnospiraceae bacterium]|nr:DUF4097 family beta strand repeat protein [Lachnospiraceae bacterium]